MVVGDGNGGRRRSELYEFTAAMTERRNWRSRLLPGGHVEVEEASIDRGELRSRLATTRGRWSLPAIGEVSVPAAEGLRRAVKWIPHAPAMLAVCSDAAGTARVRRSRSASLAAAAMALGVHGEMGSEMAARCRG